MEIHQLRYFVAVAEEGSFSQAAEREHVSQPSLSQQIQKLEAELNHQLFDRLPRAVVLTEAGRTFLEYARQILAGLADARRAVDALAQEVTGRLAVGAIPSIAVYVLPRLIAGFEQRYPKVTFELFEDTTDKLGARLEDGTLDMVLASSGDEMPGLEQYSLGREPLLVLLPAKHRLARKKTIKWRELASQKFLLLHEVHSLSITIRRFLAENHLKPELVLLVGGMAIEALLGKVKLDAAVGRVFERDGVRYLPLPHPSGASTWFNKPEHQALLRRSLELLRESGLLPTPWSGAGGAPGAPAPLAAGAARPAPRG